MQSASTHIGIDKLSFCLELAKKLEMTGEYEQAFEVLKPFWNSYAEFPDIAHLTVREQGIFLRLAGAIAGRLGSVKQIELQEHAQDLLHQAKSCFVKCGDDERLAETYLTLGILDWRRGAFERAEDNLSVVGEILRKPNHLLSLHAKVQLAVVFHKRKQLTHALAVLNEVEYPIFLQRDWILQGNFYTNKSLILKDIQPSEECVTLSLKAFNLYKKMNHYRFCLMIHNNLSRFYTAVEDFPQAHIYIRKAIRLAKKIKDFGYQGIYHDTEAQIYAAQHNYESAICSANRAVVCLQNGENKEYLLEAYSTKFKAEIALNRQSALQTYQKALQIVEENRLGDIARKKLMRLQPPQFGVSRVKTVAVTISVPEDFTGQYPVLSVRRVSRAVFDIPPQSLVFLTPRYEENSLTALRYRDRKIFYGLFLREEAHGIYLANDCGTEVYFAGADYQLLGRVVGYCPPDEMSETSMNFYEI